MRFQEESVRRAIYSRCLRLFNGKSEFGEFATVAGASLGRASAVAYLWMNLNGLDPQQFRGLTQRIFSSMISLWQFAVAGGGGDTAFAN